MRRVTRTSRAHRTRACRPAARVVRGEKLKVSDAGSRFSCRCPTADGQATRRGVRAHRTTRSRWPTRSRCTGRATPQPALRRVLWDLRIDTLLESTAAPRRARRFLQVYRRVACPRRRQTLASLQRQRGARWSRPRAGSRVHQPRIVAARQLPARAHRHRQERWSLGLHRTPLLHPSPMTNMPSLRRAATATTLAACTALLPAVAAAVEAETRSAPPSRTQQLAPGSGFRILRNSFFGALGGSALAMGYYLMSDKGTRSTGCQPLNCALPTSPLPSPRRPVHGLARGQRRAESRARAIASTQHGRGELRGRRTLDCAIRSSRSSPTRHADLSATARPPRCAPARRASNLRRCHRASRPVCGPGTAPGKRASPPPAAYRRWADRLSRGIARRRASARAYSAPRRGTGHRSADSLEMG